MRPTTQFKCLFVALISWLAASAGVRCAAEPLKLSLQEAVRLALLPTGQARLQLASEAEKVAESRVQQTRAATALHMDAGISDRVLRFDLRSIGIDIPEVSPFVANVEFPSVVGPFTVLDSRIRASKSVVNRSAARQVQAARESVESARTQTKAVATQITAETARAYLNALRAKSETDLAAEGVKVSEGTVSLAEERRDKGLVTGSEVRRSNLDLAEARQALFAAQTAYKSALLQLVALIGIPLDTQVELTNQPVYHPESPSLEEAIQTAFRSRTELAVADLDVQRLRLNERAIAAQSLPTLEVFADAGELTVAPTPSGNDVIVSSPTYTAGFEFRVPILDGHRRASESAEIESQIRQANIRQLAARRQIEVQVRLAYESLEAAARKVELAEQKSSLEEVDSAETRARYDAGEASGVELTEARARTFRSRHDYIVAVYQHEVARFSLAEATGDIVGMKW
jgi:outer membrane protein TolC